MVRLLKPVTTHLGKKYCSHPPGVALHSNMCRVSNRSANPNQHTLNITEGQHLQQMYFDISPTPVRHWSFRYGEGGYKMGKSQVRNFLRPPLSYVRSSDRSGVFGRLLGVRCACAHLRNGESGHSALSAKRKYFRN